MGTTALLVGSIVQGAGQVFAGIAASQQAQFESQIAAQNARSARLQAAAEAARLNRDNQRLQARTRTAFGASGVTLEGTPLDVLGDAALTGAEDEALVLFGGQGRSRQFLAESSAAESRSSSALVSGIGRGAGTILTGVGDATRFS